MNRITVLTFAASIIVGLAVFWRPVPVAARNASSEVDTSSAEFYSKNVQPILQSNCYRCHDSASHRGGLLLDTPAGILKGGKDGAVLIPGHPENSLLIKLIRHEGPADDPMPMPPRSKLSDAEIATVTAWVLAGAVMPKN